MQYNAVNIFAFYYMGQITDPEVKVLMIEVFSHNKRNEI